MSASAAPITLDTANSWYSTPCVAPIASAPPVPYALPAESGLELVETDRARAAPRSASEEAETSRPRRVRPPKVELRDEPLEIIETRKEAPPAP